MSGTGLYTTEEVYRLLPAIYRIRDAEQGGVLRELVDVLTGQINVVAESLEQAYDDEFIETCAAWVAPYIGDLVGYRMLHGVVPQVASPRADVANTIRSRRRKGTVSVLEQLARDVTGWPCHAVEFFQFLVTSQYMNHVRPGAQATADLRSAARLELAGTFQAGALDDFAHTPEMRRIAARAGRYNIPNVGLFLWRVQALRLAGSPLVDADGAGLRYRLDPLGTDKPLFASPRTEDDPHRLVEPLDAPLPLLRRFTDANLAALYGAGRSLLLGTATAAGIDSVGVGDIRICDLSDDPSVPGTWAHQPQPGDTHVAVDPVLGRVAYGAAPAAAETRIATFHYGSALAVGGGGYDRSASLEQLQNVQTVDGGAALGPALASVASGGEVQILDSYPYAAPGTISVTAPAPGAGDQAVVVQAANRQRPLLSRGDQATLALDPNTTLVLDGLLLAGAPLVIDQAADTELRTLILRHCTLVPGLTRDADGEPHSVGSASLIVLHPFARVTLDHCIVGPIVAIDGAEVRANDSVIDACGQSQVAFCGRAGGGGLLTVTTAADRQTGDGLSGGGHLTLEACSVLGKVHAHQLDVSDSLLMAALADGGDPWAWPVWAERRQVGCIRFSFVPAGSRTPRCFHCVGSNSADRPFHTSLRYGDPGYMQLRRSTVDSIRTGADDESEMGVTHCCTRRSARATWTSASTSTSASGSRRASSTRHETEEGAEMGADVSRVRFDPFRDFAGVVLQQGRLLLDGDFNEYVALLDRRLRRRRATSPRSAPTPTMPVSPGCRARHRTRSRSSPRAATSRSAAAGCTSTAFSPRTTGSRRRLRPAARQSPRAPSTCRTTGSRTGRRPTRFPAEGRTLRTSTSGSAKSPPSRTQTSSRSPSASTRPRACRRRGRFGCCRTSATPPAPPTTTRSPVGSTRSAPRPAA